MPSSRSSTTYRFATAERPVLPADRARVFFDGVFSEPRLQHPEGVAVGPDGWIWCGTENGEVLRIDPAGTRIERMAKAGGFTLGLAFLGSTALFFCDNREADGLPARPRLGPRRALREPGHQDSQLSGRRCRAATALRLRQPRFRGAGAGRLCVRPRDRRGRALVWRHAGVRQWAGARAGRQCALRLRDLRAARDPHRDRARWPGRRRHAVRRRSSGPARRDRVRRARLTVLRLLRAVPDPADLAGRQDGRDLRRGPDGASARPSNQPRLRWYGALHGKSRALAHHAGRQRYPRAAIVASGCRGHAEMSNGGLT